MKKLKLFFCLFAITHLMNGQITSTTNENLDHTITPPVFKSCEGASDLEDCFNTKIVDHLFENFKLSESIDKVSYNEEVGISFKVTKEGNIVFRNAYSDFDAIKIEIERVFSILPSVTPAMQYGKTTDIGCFVSIKLPNKESNDPKNLKEEEELIGKVLIEKRPLYPGCENAVNPNRCMNEKIGRFVAKKFDVGVVSGYNLDGLITIYVAFKIDENGDVVQIKPKLRSKGVPDEAKNILEKEARRVFELLPKFQPGIQRGKPVRVPYMVPLKFRTMN